MTNLHWLEIRDCHELKLLPSSLSEIQLSILVLWNLHKLNSVPNFLFTSPWLRRVKIFMVPNLQVPELVDWPSVTNLEVNFTPDKLLKILKNITKFKALKELDISVVLEHDDTENGNKMSQQCIWSDFALYNLKTWMPKSFRFLRMDHMNIYETLQTWTGTISFDSFIRNGWLDENELNNPTMF